MDYYKLIHNDDSPHIIEYKLKQYTWIDSLIGDSDYYRYSDDRSVLTGNVRLVCITMASTGNIAQLINHLYFYNNNCKNIYVDYTLEHINHKTFTKKSNLYDYVFEQSLSNDYIDAVCWAVMLYDYDQEILDDIRDKTQKYFKFKKELISVANNADINDKTLGVHIRLNDWNACHGKEHGMVYYEDYTNAIDNYLNTKDIDNIFISSDNFESLQKLRNRYGKRVIFFPAASRNIRETEIDNNVIMDNFVSRLNNYYDFVTPFIDMLILSKCNYLITRNKSNFGISTIFLGNMKLENITILPAHK